MSTDVADLMDRQGVRLESTWRATRIALGRRGIVRFVVGEALTAIPSVALLALVIPRFNAAYLVWVLPVGLAWFSRDGRATAFGCALSLAAVLVFGTIGSKLLASPVHLLGALCVPWTWLVGASMRGAQKIAIVDRLAGDHDLYDRLRSAAAISGPPRVSFEPRAG